MSTLRTNDMSKAVQKRQAIEKAIATAAVDQLLAAGFRLGVNDGEEITIRQSTDKAAIMAALFTTDEDWLLVWDKGSVDGEPVWNGHGAPTSKRTGHDHWVRFVYGNDGFDVISDYTVSLEEHLTNATAKADEYEGMIYG